MPEFCLPLILKHDSFLSEYFLKSVKYSKTAREAPLSNGSNTIILMKISIISSSMNYIPTTGGTVSGGLHVIIDNICLSISSVSSLYLIEASSCCFLSTVKIVHSEGLCSGSSRCLTLPCPRTTRLPLSASVAASQLNWLKRWPPSPSAAHRPPPPDLSLYDTCYIIYYESNCHRVSHIFLMLIFCLWTLLEYKIQDGRYFYLWASIPSGKMSRT